MRNTSISVASLSRSDVALGRRLTVAYDWRFISASMARKRPARADPEEALALMREGRVRGQGQRSPVLLWLLKNRETLERGFEETAPSWKGLAKYLGDHGVMDGDGKPPSAVATRQAWYRARTIGNRKRPSQEAATPEAAPSPAVTEPVPSLEGDAGEPPKRFGLATLRNPPPAAPAPEPKPRPAP